MERSGQYEVIVTASSTPLTGVIAACTQPLLDWIISRFTYHTSCQVSHGAVTMISTSTRYQGNNNTAVSADENIGGLTNGQYTVGCGEQDLTQKIVCTNDSSYTYIHRPR
jgi:hypothetical protein